jgi:hypothetical protein
MGQGNDSARTGWTRKEFEARLIVLAWKDEEFRKRLLQDPKKVFAEQIGSDLPSDLKIKVLEETPDQFYLVLPQNPDQIPDLELSDEQLDLVTGGVGIPVFLIAHLNPQRK